MKTRNTLVTLMTALALVVPASFVMMQPQAEAAGGILKSANSDGKRVHKRANAKRSSSKKKRTTKKRKAKRSSSSTRRVRKTSRTSRPARTTRTKRTTRTSRPARTRTTRTTRVARKGSTTRRHVRTSPRRTRTVHNRRSRTSRSHGHPAQESSADTSSKSNIDAYITGGIGTSGFDSQRISDLALPGMGYNIAVGAKGKYLGFEFGLDGGGYSFDPDQSGTDMSYVGLFGDLKLQPTLDIFEPFAFVGLGGYLLGDGILNESSEGVALRAGVGANLRIDDLAVGLKYTFASFSFADSTGIYGGDFGAQTETVGVNLSLYF